MKAIFFSYLVFFSIPICFTLAKAKSSFLPDSFSAKVEQVRKSVISNRIKKSVGKIEYLHPGNIRFEIFSPDKIIFISNPVKSWYYRPPFIKGEPGEVTIKEGGKIMLLKFFDSLKRGLKENKLYRVNKVDDFKMLINFKNKFSRQIGIRKAFFSFKKKISKDLNKLKFDDVKTVRLLEKNNKEIVLNFSNIKKNPGFRDDNFVFEVPEKTRIIR